MKKSVLLLIAFCCTKFIIAQVADCTSHRFDQEVFSSVTVTSNVTYGSNIDANGANTTLTLDVYEPTGDTMQMRPVIIWAHGGSFLSGTKNDVDVVSLSQHFAKRGYVCVSINYRLGIPFPVNQDNALRAVYRSMQDMKAAVRFMRQDAATANTYKINPSVIFAGGTSAGAFAALHTAYLDEYSELPSQLDTNVMGNLEGSSGNPGYSSSVNAVIDLCGALGNKTWIHPGDIPFVAMHGTNDGTVPYATDMIYLLGTFQIMVVDGSYSIAGYADSIGVYNQFYSYYGADHVPFVTSTAYMDTTVRFVSNFLFRYLGCNPSDPEPLPNTFATGIEDPVADGDVIIYPNVCSDYINIKTDKKINAVAIYNLEGKEIISGNSGNYKINTSNLSPGIYFLKIIVKNNSIIKRIIKQ
jgi:para-nitrobenzyl esterase